MQPSVSTEISRESLVRILDIMYRLASPTAMPELLREIVAVGKLAIVADHGVLWLFDRGSGELAMVVPTLQPPPRIRPGDGYTGRCFATRQIINVPRLNAGDSNLARTARLIDPDTRSVLNVPILGQDDEVLGVMQWLGKIESQFDKHDEWIGPALAAQSAVAIQHSRMTDELLANAILHKEVSAAREIQMATLPEEMPVVTGYDVHGHFLPTDSTGGDMFDLVMLDGRLFMLQGDATGHGFGPALSATQLQAMFRVAFRLGADLDTAYVHVNNQLEEDLPDDRFVTAFCGFLDPGTHVVDYHSGGQGPILHYRAATDTCDWYKPTGVPLGVMPMHDRTPSSRLQLEPGDILALVSDGIYEYTDAAKEQFGEERVAHVIREHQHQAMAALCHSLVGAAREFGGDAPQADDITVVLIRRLPR